MRDTFQEDPRLNAEKIRLLPGQSAMFGYGSLLSRTSMELTLARPYINRFIPCHLRGWHRSWDVMMPNESFFEERDGLLMRPENIIYLNVYRDAPSSINGILYILEQEELAAFDGREWIYDRHDITDELAGVRLADGRAYVYVAKAKHIVPPDVVRSFAAIRRSYLKIIDEGLRALGDEQRGLYETSTAPVPEHLVFEDKKLEGTHPLLAEKQSSQTN